MYLAYICRILHPLFVCVCVFICILLGISHPFSHNFSHIGNRSEIFHICFSVGVHMVEPCSHKITCISYVWCPSHNIPLSHGTITVILSNDFTDVSHEFPEHFLKFYLL